jgi:hypothetical protein
MAMNLNGFRNEPIVAPVGFRIRRAQATVTGFQPSMDDHATDVLRELDGLLKRRIFPADFDVVMGWLDLPLRPRRAGSEHKVAVGRWADGSLADKLRDQGENITDFVLGELIDADSDLAALRYGFDQAVDARTDLDLDNQGILGYSGIRDLLVLLAVKKYKISSQPSLMNFVLNHPEGVAAVLSYVKVSAGREYVLDRQLRVKGIDDDDSDSVKALRDAPFHLSSESLADGAIAAVTAYTDGTQFDDIIAAAKVTVPPELRPRLIQYLKASEVPLNKVNAPFMVPMYLAKAATSTVLSSGVSSDDPFAVQYFLDDTTTLQVSTEAVKCAAQLYYVMVLGDELGVFDAVRFFTHRYLFRDGFAVEDPQLRRDLENYVFSEQFPGIDDLTGDERMMRCTRAGERRSFYRQVFDQGKEPVPGDGLPNSDFARLWKILMLESARYLERAQTSPNPDNFVSRQNVMQAVEDLQYNLSTTCVGMATVMTPLMYAELDFVVTRILGHPEVRKHLVPSGGSWWQVVEKLQAGQGRRSRATVLNNKARIGYELMRAIATYVSSQFELDGPFSAFISNVDAFITTQSILQEDATNQGDDSGDTNSLPIGGSGYGEGQMPGFPGMPDLSQMPGMPSIPGVTAPWPGTPGGTTASNGTNGSYGANGSYGPTGNGYPTPADQPSTAGAAGGGGATGSGDWDF